MGNMKVLAGDIPASHSEAVAGDAAFVIGGALYAYRDLESVEVASEDVIQRTGLGGAAVGGILLGGAGLVAGALIGRKQQKTVNIVAVFLDGRRMFATVPSGALTNMQAAIFAESALSVEQRRERKRADDEAARARLALRKEGNKKSRRNALRLVLALFALLVIWALVSPSEPPAGLEAAASQSR